MLYVLLRLQILPYFGSMSTSLTRWSKNTIHRSTSEKLRKWLSVKLARSSQEESMLLFLPTSSQVFPPLLSLHFLPPWFFPLFFLFLISSLHSSMKFSILFTTSFPSKPMAFCVVCPFQSIPELNAVFLKQVRVYGLWDTWMCEWGPSAPSSYREVSEMECL